MNFVYINIINLPKRVYAYLSPGLEKTLEPYYSLNPNGENYRMALKNTSELGHVDTSGVVRISVEDIGGLRDLYRASFPGIRFNLGVVETHPYHGMKRSNRLISAAGAHVYSPAYGVAVLGNIATHPDYRGRGFAGTVTAKLCQSLLGSVDAIGLNVKTENTSAIRCYERLGFEVVGRHMEFVAEVK